MSEQREMTLQEWVERLPECHLARRHYAELLSKASTVPAEAVAEYQYRMPQARDDGWRSMTREEYEASLVTGHACGHLSWTKDFELRKLYVDPPPAIDIGKLRELVVGLRESEDRAAADAANANEDRDAYAHGFERDAYKDCADQLAALIGDGGEVGNG